MDTRDIKSSADPKPQQAPRHPDEWQRSLNPDQLAGQNIGPTAGDRELPIRTAYDHKEIHRALHGMGDDELKQIPILPVGSRLEQGAIYVDLADRPPREFRATGGITAHDGHYYVPKNRVPYTIWNRLIGEEKAGK